VEPVVRHLEPGDLAFRPNRFLPPESIRSPERGSPSKVRTTSTACSSVRGPATSPSFVTWPARRTAMPSVLARPTSASVQPRTCAGPPATCPPAESRRLWMESTASRNGRSARAASTSGPSSRPETNAIPRPDLQPMSAEGNLVTRLLTRGEEAGEPGSRQVRHQLEEKGRLADVSLFVRQDPWVGDRRDHVYTMSENAPQFRTPPAETTLDVAQIPRRDPYPLDGAPRRKFLSHHHMGGSHGPQAAVHPDRPDVVGGRSVFAAT
jgi:hypothetical protein